MVHSLRKNLLFCLLALSAPAMAYILPGGSLLRRMAKARTQLDANRFQVEGTFVFRGVAAKEVSAGLNLGDDKSELQGEGKFSFKTPSQCGLDLKSIEARKKLKVHLDAGPATRATFPYLHVLIEQLCPLFSHGDESGFRGAVDKNLRHLGIDFRITSLDRLETQIAYVLGETRPEKPQFWLYKSTFFPARVHFPFRQGPLLDLNLTNYSSPVTSEIFPGKIQLTQGQDELIRFNAVKTGPSLPE